MSNVQGGSIAREENIKCLKKIYSSPKEKDQLEKEMSRIEQSYQKANQILDQIPSKIIPFYQEATNNCPHTTLFSLYNKGILYSLEGDWNKAYTCIQDFVEHGEKNKYNRITSEAYQAFGEACLEVNQFHEAIEALTKAILKNPDNKLAYFHRAAAYFEAGHFEQALEDYLNSDKGLAIATSYKATNEFTKNMLSNLCRGAAEAAVDFVPSLCHSAYGLGEALWAINAFNPEAMENINKFSDCCYEMGESFAEQCQNFDWNTIEGCVEQVKTLYEQYNQLNDAQKGELIGYAIGRYGVDIFAGGAIIKGVSAFQKVKNINRLCNLETMALSKANKEAMVASSLKHAAERDSYFKNIKIHWDKQGKHIPGKHNFEVGRGTILIEESELEFLVKEHAGKGQRVLGNLGEAGFKERVDFGTIIGEYSLEVKGQPTKYIPTTKGIITYAKDGFVHVYPTNPNATFN